MENESPLLRNAETKLYGFWGPPTATIDWCETNYEYSFYVAEFWNTVSNLFFVLLGFYGLLQSIRQGFEWRFHMQYVGIITVATGSAMFHGTLQIVHQQCDETPMVWTVLVWTYIVYNNEIRRTGIPDSVVVLSFVAAGVAFAVIHAIYRFTTLFQILFGVLALACCIRLCFIYAQVKDLRARAVAKSYVRDSLVGFAFWLMDYHLCSRMQNFPINPQGHAWWHVFMGISSYHGALFMQYVRMEQLQRKAEIQDNMLGIQTIVILDGGDLKQEKTD